VAAMVVAEECGLVTDTLVIEKKGDKEDFRYFLIEKASQS